MLPSKYLLSNFDVIDPETMKEQIKQEIFELMDGIFLTESKFMYLCQITAISLEPEMRDIPVER